MPIESPSISIYCVSCFTAFTYSLRKKDNIIANVSI